MAVYVDNAYIPHKGKEWCHLMADSFLELERFARKLGLYPTWRHNDHYDITIPKRQLAVELGAVEVSVYFMVNLRRLRRLKTK